MEPKNKIIVALDVPDFAQAKVLVNELAPYAGAFKVGKELSTAVGPRIFEYIHAQGSEIFFDCKFHDIPNTVASAGVVVAKMGIWLFNIHCLGGVKMLEETSARVKKYCLDNKIRAPKIIGVTVVTSLNEEMLKNELLIEKPMSEYVVHLARLAKKSGLDGVICSPQESAIIKDACGQDFLCVTPGIRLAGDEANDQQRVATPRQAVNMGADYLVIGRSITGKQDRVAAIKRVIEEISR